MMKEYNLVERIIVTLEDGITEMLDKQATETGASRNFLVKQIIRKHLGLPNLLEDSQ